MRRFRFAYLLASLVLVAFARPFIADRFLGLAIVDILLFTTIVAGAFTAIERRNQFMAMTALAVASAGSQVAWLLTGESGLLVAFLITTLVFYGAVTCFLLRSLFFDEQEITRDTLCQALSLYLLLGLMWAIAYALLELASPGSFTFIGSGLEGDARFERFVGFSFTTITTLGYGNVAPATPRADAISALEAVVGQIYVAIVIARLVAIQITQHRDRNA